VVCSSIDKSLPISKLIVDAQEGVARGDTVEEVSDEKLFKNNIKSWLRYQDTRHKLVPWKCKATEYSPTHSQFKMLQMVSPFSMWVYHADKFEPSIKIKFCASGVDIRLG
jgi:hypothetical protein